MTIAAKHAGFDPLSYRGKSLVNPKFTPVLKAIASKVVDQNQAEFGVGLAMSRAPENARVQINLTARAGTGIEIEIPVPESGQNLESQLMSQASIATGLPFEVFSCRCDTKTPPAGHCHDRKTFPHWHQSHWRKRAKMEADLGTHTIEALDGRIWTGHAQGGEARTFAAVLSYPDQRERPELFVAAEALSKFRNEGLIEGAAHGSVPPSKRCDLTRMGSHRTPSNPESSQSQEQPRHSIQLIGLRVWDRWQGGQNGFWRRSDWTFNV